MSAHQTKVMDVGGVAVRVSDQDRALRFYVDTLGFEVLLDVPTGGGGRSLQIVAPGGRIPIALVPVGDGIAAGGDTGITSRRRTRQPTTRHWSGAVSTPTSCCAGRGSPPCSPSVTKTAIS